MKLIDLLSVLPIYELRSIVKQDIEINGIKMDHRKIEKGDLFVCIRGFTVDGHQFAEQAIANGASAIVCEEDFESNALPSIAVPNTVRALALLANRFYQYPSQSLTLIGITGTNGKTTTSYLVERIFQLHQQKTGVIGTIQMKIGERTKAIKNTTPDALQLQAYFAEMVEEKVDVAVMEVSSHALDLGRVYGADFDIAVFTNLSQDHLDYHETMEQYLAAKSLLFTGLGNAYRDRGKIAIINKDDPSSAYIEKVTMQPVIRYGIKQAADIRAEAIQNRLDGTSFVVHTPKGKLQIHSQLNGLFNVYNMLAAIAVAYYQKIPFETIKAALESIEGVDGRFERVDLGQDYGVIVDYAHTPDSLENVLQTIKEFVEGKILVVVGSGGDRDRGKRPLMAQVALDYGDSVIFTSDNPRTEDPKAILEDMTRGLTSDHYLVIEDRKSAIEKAIEQAEAGDVVLIAGKGHENYQEINGVRYDFDDRVVAKDAIEKRRKKND